MIKTNSMNYQNFTTGFNKPAIFTAQTYGTKTSVELDHSDLDLNEVMDVFHTLIVGMGYNPDMWKQWIMERAEEYKEEENEKSKEDEVIFHNKVKEAIRNGLTKQKVNFNENWDEESASKRMDVIGQNGNEGLHYDSDGFEDYQNDDEDIEWPEPNNVLIDAKKQYDEQMKMSAKPIKKRKKKTVQDWEDEIDLGGHE